MVRFRLLSGGTKGLLVGELVADFAMPRQLNPPSFCPLSPEAYLLTRRKNLTFAVARLQQSDHYYPASGRLGILLKNSYIYIINSPLVFSGHKRAVWLKKNKSKNRPFGM
jgi:hypothetical protein